MAVPAFVGRGLLLAAPLAASGGFFPLSGESEVTISFEEGNESVFDARNGAIERVDWYIRDRACVVTAESNRFERSAIEMLMKAYYSLQAGGTDTLELPEGIVTGRGYALKPNITPGSLSVEDDAAVAVPDTKYSVDYDYGLITFSDIAGYTQPFAVTATWTSHESFALHGQNQILCKLRFHGVNKVDGRKVLAEFYRLAVDITADFGLIKRGFSPMAVRMQALPDLDQTPDASLGYYGRIALL